MSEHESLKGYGPRGSRQRRFRCCFPPLRSFWVLCPRSSTYTIFSEHVWEQASPLLLRRMPRTLAVECFTWHWSHASLTEALEPLEAEAASSGWLALPRAFWRLSFSTNPLSGEANQQWQTVAKRCTSSAYNAHHTLPLSYPMVPPVVVALLPDAGRYLWPCGSPLPEMAPVLFVLISLGPGVLPLQLAQAI